MSKQESIHTIYVVVQEGGSSGEAYTSTFDTAKEAQAFIDGAIFDCFGPFRLELTSLQLEAFATVEDLVTELVSEAVVAAKTKDYAETSESKLEREEKERHG